MRPYFAEHPVAASLFAITPATRKRMIPRVW
jgi:hypothetical protein